jgi:hypothetical protein
MKRKEKAREKREEFGRGATRKENPPQGERKGERVRKVTGAASQRAKFAGGNVKLLLQLPASFVSKERIQVIDQQRWTVLRDARKSGWGRL